MAEYDSFKVLTVTCPRCGVAAGQDCVTAKGKQAADHHTARKALVYPEYGRAVSGGPKPGIGDGNPMAQRALLRTAVVDAAMVWSEAGTQKNCINLRNMCFKLQEHRLKHPNHRG